MIVVADLSVLMPTYNHARYLRRALDAIFAQSVQPKEVIVIDDCSTDETPAILAEYLQKYSILQVYRNEPNRGVNGSVHRAFGMATGKYVFFPGSDDFILPGFIEKSMAMLERHPDAGSCCSFHSTIDGVTGEIRANPSGWCEQPQNFTPSQAENLFRSGGAIAGHTAILRRDAVAAAGIYLPDLEWHSDVFLNQVVALRHGLCHVPEMLALLTVMPGTYSTGAIEGERQNAVLNRLVDRLKSPNFADVVIRFGRSGCLNSYGPTVQQWLGTRSDIWSNDILGFLINQQLFRDLEKREERIRQCEATIRQLEIECAEQRELLVQLCDRIRNLDTTIAIAQHRIARMESTRFWKVRSFFARCKRSLLGWLKPKQRI